MSGFPEQVGAAPESLPESIDPNNLGNAGTKEGAQSIENVEKLTRGLPLLEDHNDPETEVKQNEPTPNLLQNSGQGTMQEAVSDEEVVDDDPEDPLEEPVQADDESDEDFAARRRSWSAKKAARTRAENRATETQ